MFEAAAEQVVATLEQATERRIDLKQRAPHARVLRPLPSEQEPYCRLGRPVALPSSVSGGRLATVGRRLHPATLRERVPQVSLRGTTNRRSIRAMSAVSLCRCGNAGRIGTRLGGHEQLIT